MRNRSLLWTFFLPLLSVLVASLLLVTAFSSRSVRAFFIAHTEESLSQTAQLLVPRLAPAIAAGDEAAITSICRDVADHSTMRLTVVAADGRVLGDSHELAEVMDNHADRPEVVAALAGTTGTSTRYSSTLGHQRMYVAVPGLVGDDVTYVCRVSISLRELSLLLRGVYGRIAAAGLVMALVAGLMAFLLARRIRSALLKMDEAATAYAAGDFGHHLVLSDSVEINSVAESLNRMAAQLADRIGTIEKQRNELEAYMTSMVEGVVAVDTEENVISLNRAAAEILGQDRERSLGRSIQEVGRHPDLTRLTQEALAGADVQEKDIYIGSPRSSCLQATATSLLDLDGRRIGALLVMNDVTRLRRLETMRRDFVANVSHELKTPITSIKGFVETLLETPPEHPEEMERFLGIINKQADRLATIISDLLALSRLEQDADGPAIELMELPLFSIMERVVRDLAARDREQAERVMLECENKIRAVVNAPLLEQAVTNLVDNALKYSEPGAAVTIRCAADAEGVRISVIDQGPGIAGEHLPRLFERFYRVDKARSRRMGGTGLGLAIVKHIAQAHGGRVDAESVLGVGSTFSIVLKRKDGS